MEDLMQSKMQLNKATLKSQTIRTGLFEKIEAFFVNSYYLICVFLYFINVFINIRPALILLSLDFALILVRLMFSILKHDTRLNVFHFLFIWCAICVGFGFANGLTASVTLSSFVYVAFPMALAFEKSNKLVDADKFLFCALIAIVFNCIFGTLCFYLKPSFFLDYVSKMNATAYSQVTHHAGLGRLITLFGSIETGIFSAFGIVISFNFLQKKARNKFCYIIALIICSISLILTQQRGPLFDVFLIIVISLVFTIKRKNFIKGKYILLIALAMTAALIGLLIYKPTIFSWMRTRILNPSSAIDERYGYQWETLNGNLLFLDWLFGKGIGRFGFFIDNQIISNRIFDQMYFNLIGEQGIVGLLIYLFVFIKSFVSFAKAPRQRFCLFFIIFVFAFSGLGTTLIYYPEITPMIWFSSGFLLDKKRAEGVL